jgi:hypothetical protein
VQDLTNITTQLTSEGLFQEFKRQLAKDFEQSNFSSDFISELQPEYDLIHKKMVTQLQRNEQRNLMQLLYRIDISDSQLKKYLLAQKDEDPLNVIAELIIKRTLQKVVIKRFYKNKSE